MKWKRIVCIALCAVIMSGCKTAKEQKIETEKIETEQAETEQAETEKKRELQNPIIADDGIVTWDCVYFGNYLQDDIGTEKEPIKWRVLSVNDNDAFLMSDQILALRKYNEDETEEDCTWHTCSLRSWLNKEFMDEAFSEEEQKSILTVTIDNSIDSELKEAYPNTESWPDETPTEDKVFCLSSEEVKSTEYGFSDAGKGSITRKAESTEYVKSDEKLDIIEDYEKGAQPLFRNCWWLRTIRFSYRNEGAIVSGDGTVNAGMGTVPFRDEVIGVRPALHLDLSDTAAWTCAGEVSSE